MTSHLTDPSMVAVPLANCCENATASGREGNGSNSHSSRLVVSRRDGLSET